jgi:hypothetical protein
MKREDISDAMNLLDDDIVESTEKIRKNGKQSRKRKWVKWGAVAACLCLIIAGTINTMLRFDYFKAGCSAWPGTIVDGTYYYNVPHRGVYSYTPGGNSKMLLSAYWEDGWLVNEYGLYYVQGRSLFVQDIETGNTRKLYSTSLTDSTHIGFTLQQDGNIILTVYNKNTEIKSELLLDGKTGEMLQTVMEPTSYDNDDLSYSKANYQVGNRRLQLVLISGEDNYDLLENGKSILPENITVSHYSVTYYGDNLWFNCSSNEDGASKLMFVVRPDGNDKLITIPSHYYSAGTNEYLFYQSDNNAVWCLEIASGDTWQLNADTDVEVYELATDGKCLYTCVPWNDGQACWKLECDKDGKPVSMRIVSEDIVNE